MFFHAKTSFVLRVHVSNQGVSADPVKVRAISKFPDRQTLTEALSFHGLVSFYRRFIKGFSTITTPITECLKLGTFKWTPAAHKAYLDIKQKMVEAPVLKQTSQRFWR